MNKLIIALLFTAVVAASCSSASTNIFGKKTPLEQYEEKLEDSGLEKTPEGRQWLAASEAALHSPQLIPLPYRQVGNFPPGKPRALGLSFAAKPGERLNFAITKSLSSFTLYAELFKQDVNGNATLLHAADTNATSFGYNISEEGSYILKLQPELFRSGTYNLSISIEASLGFPVSGNKASIGSFWGADRDGGKRNHEGIDIFAPKRTPAIAAADGYITGVREGGIGGKTVWLRPANLPYTLYYAHLDEQLVQEGQAVKKGDVLGLVGNTGNAKYTPSHLHFGVYGYGGAVNPLPFVDRKVKAAPLLQEKKIATYVRLLKDLRASGAITKKGTLLVPIASTDKGYIAELPSGQLMQTSYASVQSIVQPLQKTKAVAIIPLFNTPSKETGTNKTIQPGEAVSVFGYYNDFVFIKSGSIEGWALESSLKG